MSERLINAKRLLSVNGIVFISINDNEQASLKLLCGKIFGKRNFLLRSLFSLINVVKPINKLRKHTSIFLCIRRQKKQNLMKLKKTTTIMT